MDLLIAANSVAKSAADTVPSSGTPQYATDGNPVTGVAPTTFPAYHYNMLMAELYNLVTAAGLTPSSKDWTQVQQAITVLSDIRYIISTADSTSTRISNAGINTVNGQPWVYSGKTFYNLVFSDTNGVNQPRSIGVNDTNTSDIFPWFVAYNGNFYNLATREWAKGLFATISDLPFGAGVHCQVFTVTIPSGSVTGYNSSGYTASIPTAFSSFMYAMGCDTSGGIYTVACAPSGNGSVKIYAQSPQNTSGNQTGGLVLTIYAYGTY